MVDWNSVLKFTVGALAGSGLLYWLFKTLGARFIDHLFKSREAEQDHRHKERLQEMEHRFSVLQQEHGTTFTELHKQRAEVLRRLNNDLWDHKLFLLDLRSAAWGSNPPEWRKSIFDQARPRLNSMYEDFSKNRIYLSDEVCAAIEKTINLFRELNGTLLVYAAYEPQRMPSTEEFERIELRLSYECREVFLAMQDEFRKLLGVKAAVEEADER